MGYVDVNYSKILKFGESQFPPLGAPREQNAPLCHGIGEWKSAVISKQIFFFSQSSRSYIVLALKNEHA